MCQGLLFNSSFLDLFLRNGFLFFNPGACGAHRPFHPTFHWARHPSAHSHPYRVAFPPPPLPSTSRHRGMACHLCAGRPRITPPLRATHPSDPRRTNASSKSVAAMTRGKRRFDPTLSPGASALPVAAGGSQSTTGEPDLGGATDVRVRVLRGEEEIPAIVSLCAAVFKQVAGGGLLAAIDAVTKLGRRRRRHVAGRVTRGRARCVHARPATCRAVDRFGSPLHRVRRPLNVPARPP